MCYERDYKLQHSVIPAVYVWTGKCNTNITSKHPFSCSCLLQACWGGTLMLSKKYRHHLEGLNR